MHVKRLGGLHEVPAGVADMYIIGGGVGPTLASGLAYGGLNIPTIMQHEGGTIGKALALHMAAVLPSMSGHSINNDDQYDQDYTTQRIEVVDGYSPVPEEVGLDSTSMTRP